MNEYIYATNGEPVANAEGNISLARKKIVRCRDCVHLEMQKIRYSSNPIFVCLAEWCKGSEGDNPLVDPDGFCAWGDHKEVD